VSDSVSGAWPNSSDVTSCQICSVAVAVGIGYWLPAEWVLVGGAGAGVVVTACVLVVPVIPPLLELFRLLLFDVLMMVLGGFCEVFEGCRGAVPSA
jgi:hypothetical protein